jgi:CBS domain-containing protein
MPHRTARSIVEDQRLVTSPADVTVREAARLMKQNRIGALLVVDDGGLVGIFTERDALFRVIEPGLDPDRTRLAEVMTRDPRVIEPDRPFGHALHLMYEGGFRHVPVVENGKPVGIVSARDALALELREFLSELDTRSRIGEILG